jgi:condensin complex subunit 1
VRQARRGRMRLPRLGKRIIVVGGTTARVALVNPSKILNLQAFNVQQPYIAVAMDERVDFDINDALKLYLSDPHSISTPEAPSELLDCESDPDALDAALVNSVLNPVVDSVAENPEAITRRQNFDTLQFLLKCAPTVSSSESSLLSTDASTASLRSRRGSLAFPCSIRNLESDCPLFARSRHGSLIPPTSLSKILDLVVSSLSHVADMANADIEAEEQDALAHHKQLLEVFGFLLQWSISAVETKACEKQASAPSGRGRKGAGKAKGGPKDTHWDPTSQLISAMETMAKVLKLKLVRIFVTTPERDTFVSLFTRPVYLILENEMRIKNTSIKMHAFKVLCIAVKHHGQAFGKQGTMNTTTRTNTISCTNFNRAKSDVFRTLVRTNGRIYAYIIRPI